MARPAHDADDTLIELFLDMLAAERGARENTLQAYRRDLADFGACLRQAGSAHRDAHRATTSAAISARLSERGFQSSSVARKLSAIRQLYRFLYAEGHRKRRSRRDAGRTATRPRLAEDPFDQRRRPPADGMRAPAMHDEAAPRRSGCARRGCIVCSNCSTPPACGCRSWSRCRPPPRGATSAC